MDKQKRKSWIALRFSTRTFLAAVTLFGITAGLAGNWHLRSKAQKALVAKLVSLGATLEYENGEVHLSDNAYGIRLPFSKTPPNEIAAANGWHKIQAYFAYHYGTDIAYSVRFAELDRGCETQESVKLLARLNQLRRVDITLDRLSTEQADEVCQQLATFWHLDSLTMSANTRANRVPDLSKLSRLSYLKINFVKIAAEDIKHLSQLSNLRTLHLVFSDMDSGALSQLSTLTQLEELQIKPFGRLVQFEADALNNIANLKT